MDSKIPIFFVHEFWVGGECWLFRVGFTNAMIIERKVVLKQDIYSYMCVQ